MFVRLGVVDSLPNRLIISHSCLTVRMEEMTEILTAPGPEPSGRAGVIFWFCSEGFIQGCRQVSQEVTSSFLGYLLELCWKHVRR